MRKEPERTCLSCGKTILVGRSDKRFCDDIYRARNTRKQNKVNQQFSYENSHRAVIDAIKRNYRLLKKALVGREKWVVDFSSLNFNGFDNQFYTSAQVMENGKLRCYCFELGWEDLNDGSLLITIDPQKLNVFDHRKLNGYYPSENHEMNDE